MTLLHVQVFSSSSGKLLSLLGVDSTDQRTAMSFQQMSRRRMEPTGVSEMREESLLVVTDLNRLLYIDAVSHHGLLQAELCIDGKSSLSAVAVTNDNKLVLSEVIKHELVT